jgi:hypothetical protein
VNERNRKKICPGKDKPKLIRASVDLGYIESDASGNQRNKKKD